MARKLSDDCALAIKHAQNLHSAVKSTFLGIQRLEGPELGLMTSEQVARHVLWLLGTKIPKVARAGRGVEARAKLALAQGMLVGAGILSQHDVHLCMVRPPPGQSQRGNDDSFISLTV